MLSYLQVTCLVQPPVTVEAAVDAAAASAIAVYVERPQPDVPDSSATARDVADNSVPLRELSETSYLVVATTRSHRHRRLLRQLLYQNLQHSFVNVLF